MARAPHIPPAANAAKPLPYKAKVVSSPYAPAKTRNPTQAPSSPAQTPANPPPHPPDTSAASASKPKPGSMLGKALRTPSKLRPIFLTVSVASITAMGVWYGASLKMRQDAKQEKVKSMAAGPEERVKRLEEARGRLTGAKDELVVKIEEIRARRIAKEGIDTNVGT